MKSGQLLIVGEPSWNHHQHLHIFDLTAAEKMGVRATASGLEICLNGVWISISGVIWRSQFDQCFKTEHALLDMIELSGIPCINSVSCIRNYGSRISSYTALSRFGLPTIPSEWFLGISGIEYFYTPLLPVVMKVGNWHMGYGKIRIVSEDGWRDAVDMAAITREHIGIEPYLKWKAELRCLLIGDIVVGIQRTGMQWKSSVLPDLVEQVIVPCEVERLTRDAAVAMGADIVGIDWLMLDSGDWVALEANLAPGIHFSWQDYRPYTMNYCVSRFDGLKNTMHI